ncbi:16S rRNA (guanine(966)-N(2))-methyltransferase RsmD [Candidatus Portiera aleyrodidarum]|uniref:16S rRNA (guanine(966)-N(2))-methyltransferase RsmD n=1 Tax=Candidatus Portiera aleyrodidarum TaxID=91844 RepID=UPI00027B3084|nr:16S rRNA (guanine(966)-N(2))-methyltransferase RsmD [Candidatus Portiera aleyrodidarum]AFQ24079.1 16S rRNA m(2)G-966 methyltransferase [Candidatus Portiera aleyrodidarum BT-B-HRs]AFS18842.1 Ribosomal RNA small subunit methyltransferase D [Candidatus Portiera aleyrodidarum BT-QVLC]AFT80468.1 Ribosomal RNA small subunit methyltransferase D [Candidatus Portiera aleyrodidarum BT-QVLC]AFT80749.1 Ribosomal RNA small subunit methyltransferase D [Candidatus Portiera aleyrodidarum BT-B-HRs]ASX27122.
MINYFNVIRLIGGCKKRSILNLPYTNLHGGRCVRPTLINVREIFFDLIKNDITNKTIFDLYAGSGSLGFEAISRGAKYVLFLETNKSFVKNLYLNKKKLKFCKSVRIIKTNSIKHINKVASNSFDIIFIDPPFCRGLAYPSINLLELNGWLNDKALIYLEVESKLDLFLLPNTWTLYKELTLGNYHILLYRRFLNFTATQQRKK